MRGGNFEIILGSVFSNHKPIQIIFSSCIMYHKRGSLSNPNKILINKVMEQLIINIWLDNKGPLGYHAAS